MSSDINVDLGDAALRLLAAIIAGGVLGFDREWHGKRAGIRTLALVALGAAFVAVSTIHYAPLGGDTAATSRIIQGVIQGVMTGVGFLGAGAILKGPNQEDTHGLTTAATVWVTAAIGIACALAAWPIIFIGVGFTLVVLVALHPLDRWFDERRRAARPEDAQL